MNMQKAILYARTATAEIVDPAYAIENQIKAMQSYCNESGRIIYKNNIILTGITSIFR